MCEPFFNLADQRYYSNQFGRFMTPDPYKASGGPADPQSWNRYAYTRGDPVNRYDPSGLSDEGPPINPFEGILSLILQSLPHSTSNEAMNDIADRKLEEFNRSNDRLRDQLTEALGKLGPGCSPSGVGQNRPMRVG